MRRRPAECWGAVASGCVVERKNETMMCAKPLIAIGVLECPRRRFQGGSGDAIERGGGGGDKSYVDR